MEDGLPTQDDGGADELPIDPSDAAGLQAKHALSILAGLGVLSYHRPYNLADPAQVDALRQRFPNEPNLPDDGSVRYLVYVRQLVGLPTGRQRFWPVLMREGHVAEAAVVAALPYGIDVARSVLSQHGILIDAPVDSDTEEDAERRKFILEMRAGAKRSARHCDAIRDSLSDSADDLSEAEEKTLHATQIGSTYGDFTSAVLGMLEKRDPRLAFDAAQLLAQVIVDHPMLVSDDIEARVDRFARLGQRRAERLEESIAASIAREDERRRRQEERAEARKRRRENLPFEAAQEPAMLPGSED